MAKIEIAIVFRGDRGLELDNLDEQFRLDELRSSFGAIEDWNTYISGLAVLRVELRSSFGAIEDWNRDHRESSRSRAFIAIVFRGDRGLEHTTIYYKWIARELRSSFGAIEDWNHHLVIHFKSIGYCDRLSGRSRIGTSFLNSITSSRIAIVFRGDRGLEQLTFLGFYHSFYCDRLSGRSRIGTPPMPLTW